MATYKVTRELGEGSHGVVFLAQQVELKRRVAMKRLRPEMLEYPSMVERFAREAYVCGCLNHPNIVTVYDSGVDESGPFIVFELLRGETLFDLGRREGPLQPSVVLDIADEILLGLASAHACGFVHRDIKPTNVFLSVRPDDTTTVKLLDFGIAKSLVPEGRRHLTNPGDVVGSFSFMAPEQLFQEPVDGRADVYSVGVCMYLLLSGEKPFDASTVQDLILQLNADPTPLHDLVPAISSSLSATVRRALERNPADRFASAEEMRAALATCREKDRPVGRATLTDITIHHSSDRMLASGELHDVPTIVPPEEGITEPRIERNQGSRPARPSEAETIPQAISTVSIALSVQARVRDASATFVPLKPSERTARMAAPVGGSCNPSSARLAKAPGVDHEARSDTSVQHQNAPRKAATFHNGTLPRVTPQPTSPGVAIRARATKTDVESGLSLKRRVLQTTSPLAHTTSDRNAETSPALRLAAR